MEYDKMTLFKQLKPKQRAHIRQQIDRLVALSNEEIEQLKKMIKAVRKRRDFFIDVLHNRQSIENMKRILKTQKEKGD